ncbi:MAG: class I tRNA ligase family protein, partial [Candidatus Latescibacterota bacterium]|nr:class I tRNA ligase family protein [Candidatus Latescibacterota bacterium]
YGADATRFSLLAQAGAVQDVRFDAEVKDNVVQSSASAEMGRNFGNKVWNAARFVTMNMDGYVPGTAERGCDELADRWIWSRLAQTIAEVNSRMEAYRFSDVIRALYDFLWRDYCDWYLELAKGRLQADQPELRQPVQRNLVEILESGLRLLHPVMPFMTESLWQALPKVDNSAESIVVSSWPETLDGLIDTEAERNMDRVQEIVTAVRTIRSEMNVPPATRIPVILSLPNENGLGEFQAIAPLVGGLVRASETTVGVSLDPPPASGSAVVGTLEIFVPLEGIIDIEVERARLEKEVAKFEKLVQSMNGKLSNEKFIANAPADVVEKERGRLVEYGDTLESLRDSLRRIS